MKIEPASYARTGHTEETGIGLAAIDMQCDHIGLFEQFVQRGATMGIAMASFSSMS